MKTPTQLINSYEKDPTSLTKQELHSLTYYIRYEARLQMDSCEYGYLLGWWVLGDWDICLSPKEAGLD